AFLVAAVAFALALTLWILPRFGGPGVSFGSPYQVKVSLPDAQGLDAQAVVLARGVQIGTVKRIAVHGNHATVTLDIDGRYAPLRSSVAARIGERTAIGDAYVDL